MLVLTAKCIFFLAKSLDSLDLFILILFEPENRYFQVN